jgi:diaminohydroxyphosphoribosylaminopyrimidine deaminase/5-amino-6-(5-phosphoribosylamino)uracil reductase
VNDLTSPQTPDSGQQLELDRRMMQRCLALARLGGNKVAPNPQVGCVIALGEHILAEGYHRRFGGAHAEVDALDRLGTEARRLLPQATLYVNLEPCSHHGKTPPCADRLVREGLGRVVAGMRDPNPLVSGRGLALLEQSGIEVREGVLESACRELNKGFVRRMTSSRPWVLLKWAQSADGQVAGTDGRTLRLSNAWSDRAVHRLRAASGAVLIGARTALTDHPSLLPRLVAGYRGAPDASTVLPLRIVLDTRGNLEPGEHLLKGLGASLLARATSGETAWSSDGVQPKPASAEGWSTLALPPGKRALPALLDYLGSLPINELLVEGGPATHRALLEAGLWDEALIIRTPVRAGPGIAAARAPGQPWRTENIGSDTWAWYRNSPV